MQEATKSKIPQLTSQSVSIAGASFETLDLNVALEIDNPNPFGLTLDGFDYALDLNGNGFLNGEQSEQTNLNANGSSTVSVPIRLTFKELSEAIPTLWEQDEFNYDFKATLPIRFPVLGIIKVPVETSGTLPVLRAPRIANLRLQKKSLGLTGAELDLSVEIDNPNAFDLSIATFSYSLEGNAQQWASGSLDDATDLLKKSSNTLTVPIRLNFLALGRTVFNLLSGNKEFGTRLTGTLGVSSSLDYLPSATIPIDFERSLSLE